MVFVNLRTLRTKWWCALIIVLAAMVMQVTTLNGPNVCMVKQKYNITKRVKYRAPMSVRTYVWCFSMPPRCSMWKTEMRDLTRLETEERTAEVAVCCPGYKMKDVSCVPICPNGKTGSRCSEDCPSNRWGPNCVNECPRCQHGDCSAVTGECHCQRGWQGESCELRMTTSNAATSVEEPLITHTSTKISFSPTTPATTTVSYTTKTLGTPNIAVTYSAFTPTTTSAVMPTVASTKMTFPITSEKTTATIQIISENPKIINQTNTESYKKHLPTSTTIAIEEAVNLNLQTNAYNDTTIILPTTPSIVLKTIPTIASKNFTKETKLPIFTNLKTAEEIKETNTPVITSKMGEKTILSSVIVIPATSESTKNEIEASVDLTTTYTTAKLNSNTGFSIISNNEINKFATTLRESTIIPSVIKETTKTDTTKAETSETETPKSETTKTETTKTDTTQRPESTLRFPTTVKFKPKEIWIKPAQKGEQIEAKKIIHDASKHRVATNKEFTANTTPKTIIVSIIPTSVSYATFKKIALTTTSFMPQKSNISIKVSNKSTEGFTKQMSTQTFTTPATVIVTASVATTVKYNKLDELLIKDLPFKPLSDNDTSTKIEINKTNSMKEQLYVQTKPILISTTAISPIIQMTDKKKAFTNSTFANTTPAIIKAKPTQKLVTEIKNNTKITTKPAMKVVAEEKSNHTKTLTHYKVTTEDPMDEETFHILTEPEHITAVMGEKEAGRSSIDLVSVISIAGGVMMAVITVAVVIVMIERCRRPRYEDVRKINDIRMQVMIDGNDAPPPYVRSIFHTPLPEPPMTEKCHYQPISTLDRNLKQFMRPVVVQTISPIMLENFRGILECHYDHLPRRSHDFVPMEARCSLAPSMSECEELHQLQHFRDSTLESLKCEAKLDVIDTTTSEPLYAEIPCWRPPSEHAIEILNLNGEAVTEL